MIRTLSGRRAIAVPLVLILLTVIVILTFSLKNTGTDYYRQAVSDVKALRIEKCLEAFFNETLSLLNHTLNDPQNTGMQSLREELLGLPADCTGTDIKGLIFKPELVNLYSNSLKKIAKDYGIDSLPDFIRDRVSVTVVSSDPIPVPKFMKLDTAEKRIVIKLSARMDYLGITRENGMNFKLKIVRVTLPVLSNFTLFVKDSYLETDIASANEKGLGYNIAIGRNGNLLDSSKNPCGGMVLDNGNDPAKNGMIFLGDGSGNNKPEEQTVIRLVEEKNVIAANKGECPYSNIRECGIDTHMLQSKRGYRINTKGQIFVFLHGFGEHLKTDTIMTNYSINNFFHASTLPALKAECGLKNLDYSNMDQCSPLLLFGDNLNLSPTRVYGNVRRTYARLTNYDQSMGLCYFVEKPASGERDILFSFRSDVTGSPKTSFNAHTGVKYDTVYSTIVNQPYSVDDACHLSTDYSDEDTDTGFDLFKYNYADFNDSTTSDDEYQKGISNRICREFDNETVFKQENLRKKGSLWQLDANAGIVCVKGDLDLTSNGSVDIIENQKKCIIIVQGTLTLPEIRKSSDPATASFISAVFNSSGGISEGGKIVLRGKRMDCSLFSWLDNPDNLNIESSSPTIKGCLAVRKLFLGENFTKNGKVRLSFDQHTKGKNYYFSFLPERAEVW